ncbi:MAG TPA: hypothetical protein VFA60_15295 [Terriglobales bacterium]|nr:hypothetical protein [Terriglobales bacterium]
MVVAHGESPGNSLKGIKIANCTFDGNAFESPVIDMQNVTNPIVQDNVIVRVSDTTQGQNDRGAVVFRGASGAQVTSNYIGAVPSWVPLTGDLVIHSNGILARATPDNDFVSAHFSGNAISVTRTQQCAQNPSSACNDGISVAPGVAGRAISDIWVTNNSYIYNAGAGACVEAGAIGQIGSADGIHVDGNFCGLLPSDTLAFGGYSIVLANNVDVSNNVFQACYPGPCAAVSYSGIEVTLSSTGSINGNQVVLAPDSTHGQIGIACSWCNHINVSGNRVDGFGLSPSSVGYLLYLGNGELAESTITTASNNVFDSNISNNHSGATGINFWLQCNQSNGGGGTCADNTFTNNTVWAYPPPGQNAIGIKIEGDYGSTTGTTIQQYGLQSANPCIYLSGHVSGTNIAPNPNCVILTDGGAN